MIRVGLVIVLLAVLAATLGPVLTPYDPAAQTLEHRLEPPSRSHPLGLDELGRDILSRLLSGARISLLVGLVVVSVSSLVGMALGSIAGYVGGAVDDVISRATDILMAFPGILLAIALVAVLGPSLTNVILALCVIGWVGYASPARIVVRHVLPTAFPAVIVQATLGMAGAIIAEASLSFLGLGVQPPTPSWGTMLDAGRAHLFDAPHLPIVPGVAIATLVLGFNFLGDGLRDRIDPKGRL
jgi:peptide/nickel transport system permease protein